MRNDRSMISHFEGREPHLVGAEALRAVLGGRDVRQKQLCACVLQRGANARKAARRQQLPEVRCQAAADHACAGQHSPFAAAKMTKDPRCQQRLCKRVKADDLMAMHEMPTR